MGKTIISLVAAVSVIFAGYLVYEGGTSTVRTHEGFQAKAFRSELSKLKSSGLCGDYNFDDHPIGAEWEMAQELSFLREYEVCLKHKRYTLEPTQ